MATIVKMKPKESTKALAEPVHAASNWMPPPSSVEEAAGKKDIDFMLDIIGQQSILLPQGTGHHLEC